jgi:hypothetical protein
MSLTNCAARQSIVAAADAAGMMLIHRRDSVMKWKDHVQNFGLVGSHLAITARVARLLLLSFVVTFLTARIVEGL